MELQLPYGRRGLRAIVPDDHLEKVLRSREVAPVDDPAAAVRAALSQPLGPSAQPLAEAARGVRDVVIVISDITRPVPYPALLPPLLTVLEQDAGIAREKIRFLVATGLHRPNLGRELIEMVGEYVAGLYEIENHQARDRESHVEVGTTARGTRVLIDRRYVEAEFRIATSLVEPHLMAGYSGGRKAVCPGLAAAETIGRFHGAEMLDAEGVEAGRLEGNPLHEELLEAARLAGCEFSINVTMDARRRLTGVFAGELDAAHRAGCRAALEMVSDTVDSPVDVVLTTAAGHPLDATFYQAAKGLVAAAPIVKPGGRIILAAECAEGLGSEEFAGQVRAFGSRDAFLERIRTAEGFIVDQWQLQMVCQVLEKAEVVVVSDRLESGALAPLGIQVTESVEEPLAEALQRYGRGARVAAIPEGPYVLALCRDAQT